MPSGWFIGRYIELHGWRKRERYRAGGAQPSDKTRRASPSHVVFDKAMYSVPWPFVGKDVRPRLPELDRAVPAA